MLDKQYLRGFTIENHFEDEYLYHIPAIRHLPQFSFKKPVTFFVGENGSGKSTLLEALAVQCGFNAEGGTRNIRFATSETHSSLYHSMKVVRSIPFPSDGFFYAQRAFTTWPQRLTVWTKSASAGQTTVKAFLSAIMVANPCMNSPTEKAFCLLCSIVFTAKASFFWMNQRQHFPPPGR